MQELLGFIQGYIQEISLIKNPISPARSMVKELWRLPNYGIIKINFDASFTKTTVTVVVAQNNEGQVMGACTYPYE